MGLIRHLVESTRLYQRDLLISSRLCVSWMENELWKNFGFPRVCVEPSLADFPSVEESNEEDKWDGIFWAVPKKRRSQEVRKMRKFGNSSWQTKMIVPKTNLRICDNCGHHYEFKTVCKNCYEKIRVESEGIRAKIEEQLGMKHEDKGVVVLYENETVPEGFTKDEALVVEMGKKRPNWFSKNLLASSTTGPNSDEKRVTVPNTLTPIKSS